MNRRGVLSLVMTGFSLTAASGALAQLGGGRRGNRGDRDPGQKGGTQEPSHVNMLEIALEELHEDLKLGAEQEAAWQTYARRVRALAGDIARQTSARQSTAQMTLLQRIDGTVDVARDRLTAVEDIAQSAKALYAMLAPEQKAAADPRLANLVSMTLVGASSGGPQRAARPKG